jgi:hypothetical protein
LEQVSSLFDLRQTLALGKPASPTIHGKSDRARAS